MFIKKNLFLIALIISASLVFSCSSGGDSGGEEIVLGKQVSNGMTYTLDDFTASPVKFKKLKEYKVDQLTYAKSVYYG